MEELARLKKKLEKAITDADENEALDVIRALDRVTITVDSLGKTKIGLAVGKLRKHENTTLAGEATKLVTKWKKAVADQTPTKPNFPSNSSSTSPAPVKKEAPLSPTPSISSSTTTTTTTAAPSSPSTPKKIKAEDGAGATTINGSGTPIKQERPLTVTPRKRTTPTTSPSLAMSPIPTSPTLAAAAAPKAETKRPAPIKLNDATRQKCFEMLAEALEQSESDADYFELALDIEAEMFKLFGETNPNYKAKFRQLFMNLKNVKNHDLRLGVLNGHISPERLCQMTSQELASKELQEQRKALEEACLKEAIRGGQKQATTNMFRCHKCKKRECTYYQLQTRSADEPMTTFVQCTNCNNRWRF